MDDAQLLRYSRHILLPELGIDAQEKFAAAHVLIIGAGGLGNPAAQFLAAAGIGNAHPLRRRHGRPHQSAAADPLRDDRRRQGEGRGREGPPRRDQPGSAHRNGSRTRRPRRARAARRRRRTSSSTAPTISRPGTRSTAPASQRASRWCPAPRSVSTARCRCSTRAIRRARATTACSAKARRSRRRAARRWASSRRWWASSAPRRRPKR